MLHCYGDCTIKTGKEIRDNSEEPDDFMVTKGHCTMSPEFSHIKKSIWPHAVSITFTNCRWNFFHHENIQIRFDFLRFRIFSHFDWKGWGIRKNAQQCNDLKNRSLAFQLNKKKHSLWAISLICIDQLVSTVFRHIVTSYDTIVVKIYFAHLKCYLYEKIFELISVDYLV